MTVYTLVTLDGARFSGETLMEAADLFRQHIEQEGGSGEYSHVETEERPDVFNASDWCGTADVNRKGSHHV